MSEFKSGRYYLGHKRVGRNQLLLSHSTPTESNRYAVEVQADSTLTWCGNGLRFATIEEARQYALDLSWRWTAVRAWRVIDAETKKVVSL